MTELSIDQQDLEVPFIPTNEWGLDADLRFLNHGSFGACPSEVLSYQSQLRDHLEYSPVRFNLEKLPRLLTSAKASLAPILGCDVQDFCFVANASEGVMTVLNNIDWQIGDEVVVSRDSYPACRHMLTHLAQKHHFTIKVAQTPFASLDLEWTKQVIDAFAEQCSPQTRLILIDHITSPTALIYPIKELVDLAKIHGAISLVDGAHAPGQLSLALDLLHADFYVGNTHKWLMTPKSCAVLYVCPEWQSRIFPLVLSHGYLADSESRFQAMFAWTGTRDYSAALCMPATLTWLDNHGGLDALRQRNNALCQQAREVIVDALWKDAKPALPPVDAIAHMAAIPLPTKLAQFPQSLVSTVHHSNSAASSRIHPLQQALWALDYEVPIIETEHGTLLRISAQAYNHLIEYRALGDSLRILLGSC